MHATSLNLPAFFFKGCCFLALLLAPIAGLASDEVLYVIASPRQVQSNKFDLIRFENDRIAERTPLGGDVAYGFTYQRLAVVSSGAASREERPRVKTWDLHTGKLVTDFELVSSVHHYNSIMIGAGRAFYVDETEASLLCVCWLPEKSLGISELKTTASAIDFTSGQGYALPLPAPLDRSARWCHIQSRLAIGGQDGSLCFFSAKDRAVEIKKLADSVKDWNDYCPGLGLIKSGEHEVIQLTDDALQPLESRKTLVNALPSKESRVVEGIVCRKPIYCSIASQDDQTEIVLYDFEKQAEIARSRFEITVDSSGVVFSRDANECFLGATSGKRALLVDLFSGNILHDWQWQTPVAEQVSYIPVFNEQ